jgi:hypothetical protein
MLRYFLIINHKSNLPYCYQFIIHISSYSTHITHAAGKVSLKKHVAILITTTMMQMSLQVNKLGNVRTAKQSWHVGHDLAFTNIASGVRVGDSPRDWVGACIMGDSPPVSPFREQELAQVFTWRVRYCCPILTKTQTWQLTWVWVPNKFN